MYVSAGASVLLQVGGLYTLLKMMVTACTCQKWKVSHSIAGQTAEERLFFHIGFCIESRQGLRKKVALGVSCAAQMFSECKLCWR